jgi:hypothetical protein
VWFASPGNSQYFVPIQLLSGTVGSTVRLPYVPNSMVMDHAGSNLYFGSSHELMTFSTANNSLTKQDPSVPGVVLAVSPNNQTVLINDQSRQVLYLYASSGAIQSTFGGMGSAASWTPDSKTLYVTDTAAAGPGHSNKLYVYNANTGWTTCSAGQACAQDFAGAANLTVMIPGVGAYFSGNPTVARTWCPAGTVGDYAGMTFYPEGDSVAAQTDVLAATTDGQHILGAAYSGGAITLSDIGVAIPSATGANGIMTPDRCPVSTAANVTTLSPLTITHPAAPNQTTLGNAQNTVVATGVNQIVTSPAAVVQGTAAAPYSLTFVTYNGTTIGNTLPYYKQVTGSTTAPGTVGYVTLTGSSAITAPIAGAFSPDSDLFFVSTAGDNQIHYIDTTTLTDKQQISPDLPACTPVSAGGNDSGCTYSGSGPVVPATVIAARPRSTT